VEVTEGTIAAVPARSYRLYDPLAQILDDVGERWALLVLRELMAGPQRYTDLSTLLPGLGTAQLAARLRQLRAAGLIDHTPAHAYHLTDQGQRLEPAIYALTRIGLAPLRPLPGPATAYRPTWAAFALRALADTAPVTAPAATFRTMIENVTFWSTTGAHGTATSSREPQPPGSPPTAATDTITAFALAQHTLTVEAAAAQHRLRWVGSAEELVLWTAAHQLR
jgi:DNA-binding HxlR family transcriptional regulator